MALKADRIIIDERINFFMNHAAERGGIVAHTTTAGSGVAMDQSAHAVHYPSSASGAKAVGLLLCDVVSVDVLRQNINRYKHEVLIGSPVVLVKAGRLTTDYLASGITVVAGDTAYLGTEGRITNVPPAGGATVGTFESKKDENGFASVNIRL